MIDTNPLGESKNTEGAGTGGSHIFRETVRNTTSPTEQAD